MKLNLRAPISTAVAIGTGAIVLAGFFIPLGPLEALQNSLLNTAVLLAAVALLLGVLNLFSVHLTKMRGASDTALYSFFLLVFLFLTFMATLVQGPEGSVPSWIFNHIQVPIESSLMAVLTVSLAYATMRLLQRRSNLFSVLFVVTLVFTLLGSGPIFGFELPFLSDFAKPFITQVLAGAGARGILLGVGLGTVATGLRVLIGADRPFGG